MVRGKNTLSAPSAESAALLPTNVGEQPQISFLLALFFPLKGVYYLFTHHVLFRTVYPRLPFSLLISFIILALMFFFTYLPQVALVAVFRVHGAFAFVSAALMVLSESATLIAFVLENFVLEEPLADVFDAVLIMEGFEELVLVGRVLRPAAENGEERDVVKRLGEFKKSPFVRFSCGRLIEWALELPLNIIPVAGAALFIILQGYRTGPLGHYRYLQLLNLNRKERRLAIRRSRLKYTAFGSISLVLQIIPLLSTFFVFTNAIGAALWAVKLERVKSAGHGRISAIVVSDARPNTREQ